MGKVGKQVSKMVFLKARINRDERDENLPREGEVTRGKVASSSNALSNKDCQFQLPWELVGEESNDDGKFGSVCASIILIVVEDMYQWEFQVWDLKNIACGFSHSS